MRKSSAAKVVQMTCVAVPSASMQARLGGMYGERNAPQAGFSLTGILDDVVKVDAFARLITEGFAKCTKANGSLDPVDLGHFVLGHMLVDGGTNLVGDRLKSAADVMAARALGTLLDRAAHEVQDRRTGKVDTTRVAEYVLRKMKEARR